MSAPPLVSFVVVGMNSIRYLPACLGSVERLDFPPADLETIYVDNASADGSAEYVERHHPRAIVIRNRRNLGFAEGNNIGLRIAGGRHLALLNADAELHPGWVREMLAGFRADPSLGIAGCKIYSPGGRTLQHAGGYVDADLRFGHYGIGEEDTGGHDGRRRVFYVTAAAMMIARPCLDAIGLFDPAYFAYCEEIDWAEAARRAGFTVAYLPRAVAWHHEMSCLGKTRRFYRLYLRNRYRFIVKYFGARRFARAFATDILDRGGASTDRPWARRALLDAFLWNLLHLPQTIRCRGRRFR